MEKDLGWSWFSWLFAHEATNASIQNVAAIGGRTTVTVKQEGDRPSPIVLRVQFAPTGAAIRSMPNSRMIDSTTAVITYPVDVWFTGSKTYIAQLNFGGRRIDRVTLHPCGPRPDKDVSDNVWPRDQIAPCVARTGAARAMAAPKDPSCG